MFPLAALIPALVAAGKAAVLGGISGAAGYGVKKGLEAASRKRRHRLVDKIAEGASMFLPGPSPTFTTLALKVAGQAAKGIRDNVNHYNKRQRGGALLTVLKNAAKIGYKLGKDKRYKRMGAKGVTGSYNRRPAPWEV